MMMYMYFFKAKFCTIRWEKINIATEMEFGVYMYEKHSVAVKPERPVCCTSQLHVNCTIVNKYAMNNEQ